MIRPGRTTSFIVLLTLLLYPLWASPQLCAQSDPAELVEVFGVDLPIDDGTIANLQVTVADPQAGATSEYEIDFQMSEATYELVRHGGFNFALPAGFDLYSIHSVSLVDNCQTFVFEVEGYDIIDQMLVVYVEQVQPEGEELLGSASVTVDVTFTVRSIGNPTHAGAYYLAALAFRQNGTAIAGPAVSEPFEITPARVATIAVAPQDDITLPAGESVSFGATGYDEFGNIVSGLSFLWSLDCGDCLGDLSGSTLYATTVGQGHAVARVGNVSGQSGLITVRPGDMARIALTLSDTQFVGHPLRGEATATLFDAFDNLKTDYVLSSDPLYLSTGEGKLVPDVLASNSLITDGVVQMLDAGIVYSGLSTTTTLAIEDDRGVSASATVSFNGYDVINALDPSGQTVNTVFADDFSVHNVVSVIIHRAGNVAPTGYVYVGTRFLGGVGSQGLMIPAEQLPAGLDTVVIFPPNIEHQLDEDTLLVTVEADFETEGTIYSTVDSLLLPVEVVRVAPFNVVDGTLTPDTVTEGTQFGVSFEVFSEGFSLTVDSVSLEIRLRDAVDGEILATVYTGNPEPTAIGGGYISFEGMLSLLPVGAVPSEGWYPVELNLRMYSLSAVMQLENRYPDSFFVVQAPQVAVDAQSLAPTFVTVGTAAPFTFDVVNNSAVPLAVDGSSWFQLVGDGFDATVDISADRDTLNPGVNTCYSEDIYFPPSLQGQQLQANARVAYRVPGSADIKEVTSDFNGLTIAVISQPAVRIIDLAVVAPNAPKVNTLQQFQISCTVANQGTVAAGSVTLRLFSDGNSTFEPQLPPFAIDPGDTVEVFWEVIAASQPNPAEIFIVEVAVPDVSGLTPVNNVALITIETPAELELTYDLFGVEGGLASYGSNITLTVEIINHGMAGVSQSGYILVTEGLDRDGPDTLSGFITADRHIDFSYVAPQHDTTESMFFSLTDRPVDVNADQPAAIDDTSFTSEFGIIFAEAALHVEVTPLGTNLVLPGRAKDLFQIDLTNTGISSVTTVELVRIQMIVRGADGRPLDAMSVFNIGNTAFYENEQAVSSTSAGDSLIAFGFSDFVIEPRASRSLILKAEFYGTDQSTVALELPWDGVVARFTSGPNAGLAPAITSPSEGESILSQPVVVTDATLQGSFLVENNPFNPDDGPVRFSYELAGDAPVEFRVFSLTGEEVYSADLPAGFGRSSADEPYLVQWDGRNTSGYMVLNGVYLAFIRNASTGETATLKVAVVK
ncbi:MAG: hypothetical protein JSW34_11690 [Candidatus Zixiibacteriota bacterium]|nr:MAG: hypothetical protein JSW34_11690 [candidate division Zixibacteria bacterium]